MILVDTSVWVDHLRSHSPRLQSLLDQDLVLGHPFVIGELACGSFRSRSQVLAYLRNLPSVTTVGDDEVLYLIEREQLHGRGIGFIDAHLLASARLDHASIWTLDNQFAAVARYLGIK